MFDSCNTCLCYGCTNFMCLRFSCDLNSSEDDSCYISVCLDFRGDEEDEE